MKKKSYIPMSRVEYVMRHLGMTPDSVLIKCPGDWWEEWPSRYLNTCPYSFLIPDAIICPERENCWFKPAVIKGRYIMKRVKQRSDLK